MTGADKDIALAIDTGGTGARAFVISIKDGIIGSQSLKMRDYADKDSLAGAIGGAFDDILYSCDIDKGRVLGVGHGSAGVPDEDNYQFINAPNVPREFLPFDLAPRVVDGLGIEGLKMAILNDCSAGALGEWLYGWTAADVGELPAEEPAENKPGAYWVSPPGKRIALPNKRRVVYWTISTGENYGFVNESGEITVWPEAGHTFYAEKDLFGNPLQCGDGGLGHLEAAHSGSGIARVILNGIETDKIPRGSRLRSEIESLIDSGLAGKQLAEAIPPLLYRHVEDDDSARAISLWHNIATARVIGSTVASGHRPHVIALGGSMTRDMKHSIIPAFRLYADDITCGRHDYDALQPPERQPVLAVCKDYGANHVALGAAACLFRDVYGPVVLDL